MSYVRRPSSSASVRWMLDVVQKPMEFMRIRRLPAAKGEATLAVFVAATRCLVDPVEGEEQVCCR